MSDTKHCPKCNRDRDVSEFYKRPNSESLHSWCKECKSHIKPHKIIICSRCNKEKIHRAKGMCDGCWQADRLEKRKATGDYYTESPQTKICQKCNIEKASSQFSGNQNSRDRLQAWCKECSNIFRDGKLNEPLAREKHNATARKNWNEKNKFNKKTLARRRAYDKDRWRNNEEDRLKRQERDKKRVRKYNRVVGRRASQKRRAIEKGLPHDLTNEQWLEIVSQYNSCCRYCGNKHDELDLEQEHRIPSSRGGGYTALNITPSCLACNRKKHTKTEEEFIAFIRAHPREFSYAKSIP